MNKGFKRDIATSLTTFTFLVVGLSGVLMFFHLFDDYTREIHEILGLAFVLVVLFHVFYNFKSMKSYFSKKVFALSAAVIMLISAMFIIAAAQEDDGVHPKRAIVGAVLRADIEDSSKLLGKSVDEIRSILLAKGLKAEGNSISKIAKTNSTSPFEIVDIILEP